MHLLFPMYVPIHTCIVPYVSQQCKYVPRQLFNWSKITPNGVFAWMYCFLHGILRGYVRNNTYMQTHHSFTYRHSVSICHCRHIWCVCMYVLFLTYPLSIPATKAVSRQSFEKLNNCLGNIYTFAGGILRAPYYMTYIGNNTYTWTPFGLPQDWNRKLNGFACWFRMYACIVPFWLKGIPGQHNYGPRQGCDWLKRKVRMVVACMCCSLYVSQYIYVLFPICVTIHLRVVLMYPSNTSMLQDTYPTGNTEFLKSQIYAHYI